MCHQNDALRAIFRAFGTALLLFVGLYAAVGAQQVSEGRNVMPVWMPCDPAEPQCQNDPRWQDAWKFGDIFLQRQVECSMDSSALNSDHLLAACIDYSGIEIGNDTQIPVANNNWTRFKGFLATLVGRPPRASLPRASAASEAWIRGMWSTNGFVTSTPFFVPGAPWANGSEDQRTFYKGAVNATSDPLVVAAGPDLHIIYMAFNRLPDGTIDSNYMVDWPLLDKNIPDEPGKHSLVSKGPPVMIAGGNNGTFGGFRDKASAIAVANSASPAGYDLYVSYTVFTGTGRFSASHIYVARTTDGGGTWTSQLVSQSTNAISGSVLTATLSGQVSVFYRGFGSSPTIYYSKRVNNGWSKPEPILGKTYPTLMAFDQVNVKVDSTSDAKVLASEGNITPRSNGFPTAAVALDGTIFVAWQECADPVTGLPLACAFGGSPRIMLTFSKDGGSTFSQRKAADNAVRTPEANGLGYFWNVGRDNNNAHPQIMPSLSCTVPTGGTSGCLLTYWESRTAPLTTGPDPFTAQPVLGIGGYHRLMDLRGALLNTSGIVARSFQISRYPYRPRTNLVDSSGNPRLENVNDIARVNEIINNADGTSSCLGPPGVEPPLPGLEPGCIPRLNFHRNQSGGGVIYFAGDYHALTRSASWVRGANGSFKVPTDPQEVPWVGWHAISTTNQNLIPPAEPLPSKGGTIAGGNQLTNYTQWTPGTNGLPACNVGGSRNTDSYFYDISLGLLVTTPVTVKTTPSPGDEPFITFPVQVWNSSTQAKTVRFTIDTPETVSAHSSFSKNATVKTGLGTINPGSSTVHVVYVTYTPATAISPIRVLVAEVNPDGTPMAGAMITGVTFNAAGTQQPSAGSVVSSVTVSDPITASIQNASIQAVAANNITASIQNASIQNASIQNASIQAAWIVEAGGDPAAPRTAIASVDAAFLADYNFRTTIYQLSSIGACVDTNGNATVQYQARQVGSASIQNASIQAASIQAISAANGFPNDPVVDNLLFVPKPGKKQTPGTQSAAPSTTECRIGECVEAQPPETEFTVVQLVAEQKTANPSIPWDPVIFPPAITVASYWCDLNTSDCQLTEVGPDLVVSPTPGVSAIPDPVSAGGAIQFPANGYSVPNNGNRPANARRYGFYISKAVGDSVLHLLPNGQVDQTQDVLLGFDNSFVNPLLPFNDPTTPGTFDLVAQRSLTIPVNTIPGVHYVFMYADDLRKVSETHEDNNVGKVAITVLPPKYQLIGLFSPCSGLTCGPRNSGSATPIAFQLSYDGINAVDSAATKPRLKFYDSTGALLFAADPDDVSSGGSLWQYFGASCAPVGSTACVRPAYTWQYNWQTKNPVTGQNLPSGTYFVKVEVLATKQFDGPPDGEGSVATITITVR